MLQVAAPLCAAHVLFLLKAYASETSDRQAMVQTLLTFGSGTCALNPAAFRLFLEFGLLHLLQRDPMLLAPKLKAIMGLLLHATESPDAYTVLLAWTGLELMLASELQMRVRGYIMDILLRLTFTWLSFVASGPTSQGWASTGFSAAKMTNG